jgi:ribose transport system substrate-binding protein
VSDLRRLGRGAALAIAVALVVVIAACGGGGGGGEQGGGGGGGGSEGPFTIGVSNGFVSSEWRTQMIDDLETLMRRVRSSR